MMLVNQPFMKENPLKERICKVFSSDSSGNMTFDDFLNMCSLFNEQCPRNTKIHYAFQIYGEFLFHTHTLTVQNQIVILTNLVHLARF